MQIRLLDSFSNHLPSFDDRVAVASTHTSASKKPASHHLHIREQRLRELTEMNKQLNEMKEKFKRELLKTPTPEEIGLSKQIMMA